MHFHNNKSKFLVRDGATVCLFISGWFHCCYFGWIGVLRLAFVALAEFGPVLSLLLFWCVWWCLFSFVICFVLFFPPFYHSVFMFFWVCVWCLSQLPSSALSPYSTPPTPSPANGPPSPKFGRDPLSYCLKEINKTVKPRISSFRTLKKTVSVMGQGTGNRVLLLLLHGFLRHSAANESIDWSGSSIMCNGMCMGGHNKVEITPLSHTMIFNHKNINFSPYFC